MLQKLMIKVAVQQPIAVICFIASFATVIVVSTREFESSTQFIWNGAI